MWAPMLQLAALQALRLDRALAARDSTGATMKNATLTAGVLAGCVLLTAQGALAQDWPQWRGPNRDAKATGFSAPKTWPKELTQKWKVPVGQGDASPALVGDKVYVF